MTTATVLAIARDVSGERGADGALRAREERYRALLEYAADVVGILGPDGTVRYESAAVERVLGYRPEERLGRPALADVHPEDVTHVQAFLTAALAAPGATQPTTYRCRHKDGSWRVLEAHATAVQCSRRECVVMFRLRRPIPQCAYRAVTLTQVFTRIQLVPGGIRDSRCGERRV